MIGLASKVMDVSGCVHLGGSGRIRIWNKTVHSNLEINCVAMGTSSDRVTVIAAIDAVYCNSLDRQLVKKYRLKGVDVLLAASHSHSTPSLMPEYPRLGRVDSDFEESAVRTLEACIDKALDNLRNTDGTRDIELSESATQWSASRRRGERVHRSGAFPYIKRKNIMAPTSSSPTLLDVSWVKMKVGHKYVVIWSFACHPTSFFERDTISSDFPGVVREKIREIYGSDTVILFLQGASGDYKGPFYGGSLRKCGLRKWVLSRFVKSRNVYLNPSKKTWDKWAVGLAVNLLDSISDENNTITSLSLASKLDQKYLHTSEIFSDKHPVGNLAVSYLKMFGLIRFLFINAEITSSLAEKILSDLSEGPRKPIVVTCVGECIGYLSTEKEKEEGGYESQKWISGFGLITKMKTGSENKVVELSRSVVDAAP